MVFLLDSLRELSEFVIRLIFNTDENMNKQLAWPEFLNLLQGKLPPEGFAWLESGKVSESKENHFLIELPNEFTRNWVLDHYEDVLSEVLKSKFGPASQIDIQVQTTPLTVVEEQKQESAHSNTQSITPDTLPQKISPDQESPLPPTFAPMMVKTVGESIDPKHTFETFVVGASNQFAHAAARAVAEQPATQYNPLFIYSDAGLGKTHLLHAIGNQVIQNNPKARICYLSAEKFVNDLIEAIHHGKTTQFREKYRNSYDVLLMDDIQFLANKDRTQEEFFHTFNALHSTRRQIVVTSDKFPKDINGLEDRIRTRFEWGLIADIQPPEIETRIAILRAKAEIDDIFLPHDVGLFLAANIKSNIRELEGALLRLGAQASLAGTEISLDLAKQLLKNIVKEPTNAISPDSVLDAVSKHFGIRVSDLRSKERSGKVAKARQISMYLIKKYCDKSYPLIGQILGGKDHTTVIHGVKLISQTIDSDSRLKKHVEEIQNLL